jgi:thymidylate kinase
MFVVLDGPNGSGKTTIVNNLKKQGVQTLSSPNGTPLAQFLRPVCRGTDQWTDIDKTIQFLCFSAARLDEYIRLVKDNKQLIVADRWWTSTYVYQCILGGISEKFLRYTIHPEEKIDKVIILTGHSDVLIDRVVKEREKNPSHGVCTWTKERDTMRKINEIYTNELPKYLTSRGIDHEILDTTNKSIELVQSMIEITLPIGRSCIE